MPGLQVVIPPPVGLPEEVAVLTALALIITGIILFPVARAFARRLEGKGTSAQLRSEVDALHQRVTELEQVEHRIAELENRVEFSERLLTQQREVSAERGRPQ